MLKPEDHQTYVDLFESRHDEVDDPHADIISILQTEDKTSFGTEFSQLAKMVSISAHADEVDMLAAQTAKVIYQQVRTSNLCELTHATTWRKAILRAEAIINSQNYIDNFPDREIAVAEAYKRLKNAGRKVSINTLGIHWNSQSLKDAYSELNSHIALMGGTEVLSQIGRIFDETNNIYAKIWLCGETNLGVNQPKEPAIPFGWLQALALKHTASKTKARKPEVLWNSIVTSSRDIAATFDCQRYSQFDRMVGINPADLPRAIYQTLCWRELFTIQQMPQECLPFLYNAFLIELKIADENEAISFIKKMWREYDVLRSQLEVSKPNLFNIKTIEENFPTLLFHSKKAGEAVNPNFVVPMSGALRNDSIIMFYKASKGKLLCCPLSRSNAVFLTIIFSKMWEMLKNPSKTLSNITEKSLALVSDKKAETIYPSVKYKIGKDVFEFDLATQTGSEITLMEIKNKSLTRKSESGDGLSFLDDLSKSVFPLVFQLARHEKHIREKLTPLNTAFSSSELSITKIAVSTLTYGAVTDNLFLKSIFVALSEARLSAIEKENEKTVKEFNKQYQKALSKVLEVSDKNDNGLYELSPFFFRTRWVDLGQLIYLLHRSNDVSHALKPIRHLTFSSRDIWNEIAYADRGGFAAGVWSDL